ncbi:hypothetical protein NE237_015392 [Protea cynaroides]|uniref:Uncharacterized protein n=1 Tax=Protea cynaroides TaxID=273540 RepID=A0A9Q0KE65_9MAGN|nr:hypothetical protein NE237_015392 [Protea cynaroides]
MRRRSFSSPHSSPPSPHSPLPISVGPGHRKYNFTPSLSPSPPFSPTSSPTSSEIHPLLCKDSPCRPKEPSTFSLDRVSDDLGFQSSCLKDLLEWILRRSALAGEPSSVSYAVVLFEPATPVYAYAGTILNLAEREGDLDQRVSKNPGEVRDVASHVGVFFTANHLVSVMRRSFASPPSSPPTPPSPLPVSIGPGHQKYTFTPSPSPSPPFSPPSSRTSSEIHPLLCKDSPYRPKGPSTFSLDRVSDDLGFQSSCLKDLLEWLLLRCCGCCSCFL